MPIGQNQVLYRYKFTEESPWDKCVLERVRLSKDTWTICEMKKDKLTSYIEKGWVLFETFKKGQIDPQEPPKPKEESKTISKEDLLLADRETLVEVAESWGIDTVRKREKKLREDISKKLGYGLSSESTEDDSEEIDESEDQE